MATKKQKREAALAKRAAFEAETKARGLAALAEFKKQQNDEREMLKARAEEINARHREILRRGLGES